MMTIVLLAACGGRDGGLPAESTGTGEQSAEDADEQADRGEVDLGWIAEGPAGTEFELTEIVTRELGDESISQAYTLDESGNRQMLYSPFILASEVTVQVISGGPLTLHMVTGTLDNDGMSVDVASIIESVEIGTGESGTVSGDRSGG